MLLSWVNLSGVSASMRLSADSKEIEPTWLFRAGIVHFFTAPFYFFDHSGECLQHALIRSHAATASQRGSGFARSRGLRFLKFPLRGIELPLAASSYL